MSHKMNRLINNYTKVNHIGYFKHNLTNSETIKLTENFKLNNICFRMIKSIKGLEKVGLDNKETIVIKNANLIIKNSGARKFIEEKIIGKRNILFLVSDPSDKEWTSFSSGFSAEVYNWNDLYNVDDDSNYEKSVLKKRRIILYKSKILICILILLFILSIRFYFICYHKMPLLFASLIFLIPTVFYGYYIYKEYKPLFERKESIRLWIILAIVFGFIDNVFGFSYLELAKKAYEYMSNLLNNNN